mmetsp:Transcript_17445/g.25465  ORF Transcript_17445/g.25465 Transcript_17445/m.25465 type:complete len:208 (-) Transcript_17445:116-739(-)
MADNNKRTRMTYWYSKNYDPIKNGSIDGTDAKPHDRALLRALRSDFDPYNDHKIEGDPMKTVFIGNLSFSVTEEELERELGQFGRIRHLRLVRDVVTRQSKGYCFVQFEDEKAFRWALRCLPRRLQLGGREVIVDHQRAKCDPGWVPRRCGGGLGGLKESGQLRFGGTSRPFRSPPDLPLYIRPHQGSICQTDTSRTPHTSRHSESD